MKTTLITTLLLTQLCFSQIKSDSILVKMRNIEFKTVYKDLECILSTSNGLKSEKQRANLIFKKEGLETTCIFEDVYLITDK